MEKSKIVNRLGKVYCIRSNQTNQIYIGSTFKKYLSSRLSNHKYCFNNDLSYCSSFEVVKYPDCYIEIISENLNVSREMLQKLERIIIENSPNCVNKNIPTRTTKEYYYANHEKCKLHLRTVGRAKIVCCDCGLQYNYSAKTCHVRSDKHKNHNYYDWLTTFQYA